MRLWSLHPRYLDAKGLVALWREGLLAQKVLAGGAKGYRHHPQLARFRALRNPSGAIAAYLREAELRGYNFDAAKIGRASRVRLTVTRGQLLIRHGEVLTPFGLSLSKAANPFTFRQAQCERTSNIIWPDQ